MTGTLFRWLQVSWGGKRCIFPLFNYPISLSLSPSLLEILFIFREKGREREREKHQCVVASRSPPTRGLAYNPGMCLDWESNPWSFGLQAGAQSTEPHQPGLTIQSLKTGTEIVCDQEGSVAQEMKVWHDQFHANSTWRITEGASQRKVWGQTLETRIYITWQEEKL